MPAPGLARFAVVSAAFAAVVMAWPLAGAWLDGTPADDEPVLARLIDVPGWRGDAAAARPAHATTSSGAAAELRAAFRASRCPVGIYVGYYRDQDHERKLVSSDNVLVDQRGLRWAISDDRSAPCGHGKRRTSSCGHAPAQRLERLLVWHWYWIDGRLTASDIEARLTTARSQLTDAATIPRSSSIYAPEGRPGEAERALEGFLRDAGPSVEARCAPHATAQRRGSLMDARPLIVHVVYRFDVGGLENGVVNLVNRLPRDAWRHAVIVARRRSPTSADASCATTSSSSPSTRRPAMRSRCIRSSRASCRELRPAIVHTRNLAALEAVVPAWAAGVPVRIHGEHGRDVARSRRVEPPLPVGAPRCIGRSSRTTSRCRATSSAISCERVGIPPDAGRADLQRRRHRALPRPPARASRSTGCPFHDPGPLAGRHRRTHAAGQGSARTWCARSSWRVGREPAQRERLRLVLVGDGPLRGEAQCNARRSRAGRLAWLARRARRRPGDPARSRLLRAALAGRGHLEHDSRGDGERAARDRDRRRRQSPSWSRRDAPASSCRPPIPQALARADRSTTRAIPSAPARPAGPDARASSADTQPRRHGRRATRRCIGACSRRVAAG